MRNHASIRPLIGCSLADSSERVWQNTHDTQRWFPVICSILSVPFQPLSLSHIPLPSPPFSLNVLRPSPLFLYLSSSLLSLIPYLSLSPVNLSILLYPPMFNNPSFSAYISLALPLSSYSLLHLMSFIPISLIHTLFLFSSSLSPFFLSPFSPSYTWYSISSRDIYCVSLIDVFNVYCQRGVLSSTNKGQARIFNSNLCPFSHVFKTY